MFDRMWVRLLDLGNCPVTTATFESGMTHLGRFSVEHRDLFGELPSETVRGSRSLCVRRLSRRGPTP